jgi:uncharacterized membrane protein YjfL (UPF0719 family)
MPPLPGVGGPDYGNLALNMLLAVLWAIVASIGFACAMGIGLKVFSALTPGIDEWAELKKGNTSVAILWAAFTLAVAGVVIGVLLK